MSTPTSTPPAAPSPTEMLDLRDLAPILQLLALDAAIRIHVTKEPSVDDDIIYAEDNGAMLALLSKHLPEEDGWVATHTPFAAQAGRWHAYCVKAWIDNQDDWVFGLADTFAMAASLCLLRAKGVQVLVDPKG